MPSALPYKIAVLVFIENGRRAPAAPQGQVAEQGRMELRSAADSEIATGEYCKWVRRAGGGGWKRVMSSGRPTCISSRTIARELLEGRAEKPENMFTRCLKGLKDLPPDISEGRFGFFSRSSVDALQLLRAVPDGPLADLRQPAPGNAARPPSGLRPRGGVS